MFPARLKLLHRISLAVAALLTIVALPAQAQELSEEETAELRKKVDAGLTSEQSEVRRLSVLALGAMVDKKEIKDFRKYAEDADPVIKNGALVALARRGDKTGMKGIKKVLGEASALDLPRLLAELIQPLSEETQKDILSDILKKPASEELRQAVYTWIARDGSDSLYELLERVTREKDDETRKALVAILKQFPRPAALPIARELAGQKKSAAARMQGINLARAIANVEGQGHESTQVIAEALADSDEAVAAAAEKHLIELRHPAVVPVLEARVTENPRDLETVSLLLEFESTGGLLDVLMPLVERENPKLEQEQYNQILSLVAASGSKGVELVRTKLSGSFEKDRIAATHAIGYTGDKSFSSNLQTLAFDGSLAIRRAAAESFGKLGDPASLETMNKALGAESDNDVKIALVKSMGEIGDKSAVNYLQFLMTERDPALKRAALDALVALNATSATSAIELVAEDPDPGLRWHAIVSLFRIDPVVYGERLKKAVADAPEDAFFETLANLPADVQDKLEEEVLRSSRSALAIGLVKGWAAEGRAAIGKLRKAYDLNKDMDVRLPALEALARYAAPDDLERFKAEVDNDKREVRLLALRTLLRYPKAETRDIFMKQTKSDEPLFQVLGIYGLVQ